MFDDNKFVRIRDVETGVTVEGLFRHVRTAVEMLYYSGELKGLAEGWCCEDCDGPRWLEQIAVVQNGQIWPLDPLDSEGNSIGPKQTLRVRNIAAVMNDYLPGSGWPQQQKFVRREGRRAQRRFSKAIAREAMAELD